MQKLAKTNQSVQKTIQIISAMASAQGLLRLADIADKVQMPASTTLRMVNTLVLLGYAYQEPETLRYRLTLRFAQIGSQISAQFSISDMVRPFLLKLSHEFNESACLAIEEDMEVIYIDVVDGPDCVLKITQRIGKRAPMHSTGVEKLMLTQYSGEQLSQLVQRKGLIRLTPRTAVTLEDLDKELAFARDKGYALDDEECELGVRCVAAPVYNYDKKIVAAISISGPVNRMTIKRIEETAPSFMAATQEISQILAYQKA